MKTKWVSRVLCGLLAAGLLCGFAALPAEENAGLVPRQFQTAQQIDRISVEDAISDVTIRTADTDHITVDYADTTEKPLYTISVEDGLLRIQTESLDKIGGRIVPRLSNRDLVITLPQKQYQNVSVALTVGTLSVEGVKAAQLTAESAVNTVELSGIEVDQLNAASAVGKVTLRDSRIGNAEIEGKVGGVALENVTASERLTVSSVVGKISLEDVTAYELIVLSTLGRISWENVEAPYSTQASIF